MLERDLTTYRKTELLAPAGSKESFYAALNVGADAVYMAADKFGARAYADNFSDEDIFECSDYAHVYGKKIYLTVNTLVKDSEFDELSTMLEKGIFDASDGLIVQDMGVADYIAKNAPHIPLHASTQMSVTGPDAVNFLLDHGFSRVVPARELSLKQIKDIYEKTGADIECFIHGSMCYSYSGACLFSSVLGSRSGNRGRCAQPCRLPYSLNGSAEKDRYPLSLKDMCTLNILPEIIDAGAVSLKVEGRMKPPAYVSGVISIYRKYLDLILSGGEYIVDKKDLELLSSLYVRGDFSEGYYKQHNSKNMITFSIHGYNQASDKDTSPKKEETFSSDNSLPRIKVRFDADFIYGQRAVIKAYAKSISQPFNASYVKNENDEKIMGVAYGDIVEKAIKASVKREDILKSLKKLGNTVFETSDDFINVNVSEDIFYSLKGINELRRHVLEDLKNKIKEPATINNDSFSFKKEKSCRKYYYKNVTNPADAQNSLLISTKKQASTLADFYKNEGSKKLKRVYISEDILDIDVLEILKPLENDVDLYAALSFIRQGKGVPEHILNLLDQNRLSGVLVRNLQDLSVLSSGEIRSKILLISDFSLYAFNKHSAMFYDRICDCVTLPLEMSLSEEKSLRSGSDIYFEKVIYGHAPLMITANCVRKTFKSCTKAGGFETLTDRKKISFPVRCVCGDCLNIIYNSVPLMLKKDDTDRRYRVELSVEDPEKSLEVIRYYFGDGHYPSFEHTMGWQSRPVI